MRPSPPLDAAVPWQAALGADGPLEALNVRAQARVAASASHAAQALDAHAVVRPFAAWPLGELQATTEALDLSVFASAAPATALTGRAVVTTSGADRPAVVSLDLANRPRRSLERGPAAGRSPRRRAARAAERAASGSRCRRSAPSSAQPSATAAASSATASGPATAGRSPPSSRACDPRRSTRAPRTIALDGKASLVGTGFAGGGATQARSRSSPSSPASSPIRACRKPRRAARACDSMRRPRPTRSRCAPPRRAPGAARASLAGKLVRSADDAPWRASGRIKLADFDPALWWPGSAGSPLARGPNRLDAQGEFDLALPAASLPLYDALAATRGRASLAIGASTLAGVAVEGNASFVNDRRPRPAGVRSRRRRQPRARPGADRRAWQQRRRLAARARRAGARSPRAVARRRRRRQTRRDARRHVDGEGACRRPLADVCARRASSMAPACATRL